MLVLEYKISNNLYKMTKDFLERQYCQLHMLIFYNRIKVNNNNNVLNSTFT